MKNLTSTMIATFVLGAGCAQAEPVNYVLDGEHTQILWEVDRFGFTNIMGSFTEIEGALTLDEENPANSSVTAEISLSGLRSDLAQREDIVRGEFWLDAATNPTIRYRSTSVELLEPRDGKQRANVTGVMTLAGTEAPVSMTVTLNKLGADPVTKRKAAGFSAMGAFNRSDYGVAIALGPVGDTVSFRIEALAITEE
ncbi:MAG: YceI family protein [Pseudomonadota bacterium]